MRKWLIGFLVACGLVGLVVAQPVVQNQFSGNECWNAGQGPAGPTTGFLCTAQMRNGTALSLFSGSGAFTTTATIQQSTLYWVGAAPTTWTITLPLGAFDGEVVTVGTDTTLTTMVTVNPAAGQTMDGTYSAQTLTALTSVEFQFNLAGLKWYRLR